MASEYERAQAGIHVLDAARKKQRQDSNAEPEPEPWEDPTPLPVGLLPVAPFSMDLLPNTLRGWIADITDRSQCPPDYPGATALVALGVALGRKVGIMPKARDDWTEFGNLWLCCVGRPGTMKSPSMGEAVAPLHQIADLARANYLDQRADYDHARRLAEAKESAQWSAYKRDLTSKTRKAEPEPPPSIDQPEAPQEVRLVSTDPTMEALAELLRGNPQGVLVFRDELVSLLRSLDREGAEGSRGFYLQGWDGKGSWTTDRIGRGQNLHIPHVCLSVIGSTQPGRVSEYVRVAVSCGVGDDGLLQRFLPVWPDTNGAWRNVDRFPDTKARTLAFDTYHRLFAFDPEQGGAEMNEYRGPVLRLSPAALELFTEWHCALHVQLAGDMPDALQSWFAKQRKTVPAFALLMHLADHPEGGPIELEAMQRAIAIGEYFRTHADRLYGATLQPDAEAASQLLTRIAKGDLVAPFTASHIRKKDWRLLTDPDSVSRVLVMLEDRGWIRRIAQAENVKGKGGRPTVYYEVHPLVTRPT